MAGTRTKRAPFQGECWSDEDGTTYELEHEGRLVRVRLYDDGQVGFATKGVPVMLARCALGPGVIEAEQWQNIHLRPV